MEGVYVTEQFQYHHCSEGQEVQDQTPPKPGRFQGMNYSSGLAAKHHQELPRQAPDSSIHSYILGSCFLKQPRSHQLCSWKGGQHSPGCSVKGTATSPWSSAKPSNCPQSVGLEDKDICSQLIQTVPQKLCQPPFREGLSRVPALLAPVWSPQLRGCLLLFFFYCDPCSNSVQGGKWSF